MPNQQPTYREQVDAQRIIQIREILKGLPQACGDFIRSIAVTTGTFTRLAYAIDLRTFFTFLQREGKPALHFRIKARLHAQIDRAMQQRAG